jgi:ribonuclease-3
MVDVPMSPPADLRRCIARLGLPDQAPVDWALLDQALTHVTASADRNNEQLEFIGDAVLRLATAEFLRETYPDAPVGELSALRSHLVSDRTLTDLAERLGLEPFLAVAPSAAGDRAARPARLADMMEAILAALYLSQGNLSLVRPWLDEQLAPLATALRQDPTRQNYKAALQELTQAQAKTLPTYQVTEVSQVHGDPQRFQAEVWFQERCWGTGRGRSRKLAEQEAAQVAYGAMIAEGMSQAEAPAAELGQGS